jgi:hypothetical protein
MMPDRVASSLSSVATSNYSAMAPQTYAQRQQQANENARRIVRSGSEASGDSQEKASTTALKVAGRIQKNSKYGRLLRDHAPSDVRPPCDIDISMVEICTFFPNWFVIPRVPLRAVRNGFGRKHLAWLQLEAIGSIDDASILTTSNRIQKQIGDGGRLDWVGASEKWVTTDYVQQVGLQNDLTSNHWRSRETYGKANTTWRDISLYDIANSVPRRRWPQGDDRLYVTACLEFAYDNPEIKLTTAHWADIIRDCLPDFVLPPAPTGRGENRDITALLRHFSVNENEDGDVEGEYGKDGDENEED